MDLNRILLLLVGVSCGSLLLRTIAARQQRGWAGVSAGILGAVLVLLQVAPQVAGLVGGGLWLTFVVVPLVGMQGVRVLSLRERFRAARWLTAGVSWLHPADGWRDQLYLLRALERGQRGNVTGAIALLRPYTRQRSGFGLAARALSYRLEARWDDLLAWMQTSVPTAVRRANPTLALNYLRALGETGDLQALLWQLRLDEPLLAQPGGGASANLARLYALAFCGQRERVRELLAGPLATLGLPSRQFWQATADWAAGDRSARDRLLRLRSGRDSTLERAVIWRLQRPLADPRQLPPAAIDLLARIQLDLRDEARYGDAVRLTLQFAPITYLLIAANVAVFVLEARLGGTENYAVLYRLGALVPSQVAAGDWWRLVSANFLHYGAIHLAGNLLGLWFLGPYVERQLGPLRFALAYLASGVGAMGLYVLLALEFERDGLLVGASAAIMGLIGVTLVILWRGWQQERSQLARSRLRVVGILIAVQTAFDLAVPQVSFAGHALGLLAGAIAGSVLLLGDRRG